MLYFIDYSNLLRHQQPWLLLAGSLFEMEVAEKTFKMEIFFVYFEALSGKTVAMSWLARDGFEIPFVSELNLFNANFQVEF